MWGASAGLDSLFQTPPFSLGVDGKKEVQAIQILFEGERHQYNTENLPLNLSNPAVVFIVAGGRKNSPPLFDRYG